MNTSVSAAARRSRPASISSAAASNESAKRGTVVRPKPRPSLQRPPAHIQSGFGALLFREVLHQQEETDAVDRDGSAYSSSSSAAAAPLPAPPLSPSKARQIFQRALRAAAAGGGSASADSSLLSFDVEGNSLLATVTEALASGGDDVDVSAMISGGGYVPDGRNRPLTAATAGRSSGAIWAELFSNHPSDHQQRLQQQSAELVSDLTSSRLGEEYSQQQQRRASVHSVSPSGAHNYSYPASATGTPSRPVQADAGNSNSSSAYHPATPASGSQLTSALAAAAHTPLPPSLNGSLLTSLASHDESGTAALLALAAEASNDGRPATAARMLNLSLASAEVAAALEAIATAAVDAAPPPHAAAAPASSSVASAFPSPAPATTLPSARRRGIVWDAGVTSHLSSSSPSPSITDTADAADTSRDLTTELMMAAAATPLIAKRSGAGRLGRQLREEDHHDAATPAAGVRGVPTTERKQREWQRRLLAGSAGDDTAEAEDSYEVTMTSAPSGPLDFASPPPRQSGRRSRREAVTEAPSEGSNVAAPSSPPPSALDSSLARQLAELEAEEARQRDDDDSDGYSVISGGPAVTPGAKFAVPRRRSEKRKPKGEMVDEVEGAVAPASSSTVAATSVAQSFPSASASSSSSGPSVHIRLHAGGVDIVSGGDSATSVASYGEGRFNGSAVLLSPSYSSSIPSTSPLPAAAGTVSWSPVALVSSTSLGAVQNGLLLSPTASSSSISLGSASRNAYAGLPTGGLDGSSAAAGLQATTVRVHRSGSMEVVTSHVAGADALTPSALASKGGASNSNSTASVLASPGGHGHAPFVFSWSPATSATDPAPRTSTSSSDGGGMISPQQLGYSELGSPPRDSTSSVGDAAAAVVDGRFDAYEGGDVFLVPVLDGARDSSSHDNNEPEADSEQQWTGTDTDGISSRPFTPVRARIDIDLLSPAEGKAYTIGAI